MAPGSRAHSLVLLAASYVAAVASVTLRPAGTTVATWYPAAGFVVAVIVLSPRRRWPLLSVAVFAVLLAASLTGHRALVPALTLAATNTLQALTAGLVVRRDDRDFRLRTPDSFFQLALGCLLASAVMALGAAGTALITGDSPGRAAATAGPSHLAAMLVILPLLLFADLSLTDDSRPAEMLVQVAAFAGAIALDFWATQPLAVGVLALPVLVWAGLRFAPVLLGVELLLLGAGTIWFTAWGRGPFAPGAGSGTLDAALAGARVQLYLVCAALLAVPAALAYAQRRELLRSVLAEQRMNATTLDTTAALVLVTDGAGTVLRSNPVVSRLTGYAEDEIVGRPLWLAPFVGPLGHDAILAVFQRPDGSGVPRHREIDLRDTAGEWRRVVWDNSPVLDASGRMTQAVFTGMDLTDERAASGMLRHLLDAPVPTALVGLDPHGRVSLFSHGAQQMLGWEPDDVLGLSVSELVESTDPLDFVARVEAGRGIGGHVDAREVTPATEDWKWRSTRGEPLVMATTISVVLDQDGEPVGYLCVGRDVTQQRRTQEMLERALQREREGVERLRQLDAMKDEFVSTVSHELRTPTTNIVGYTEMLLDGEVGEPTSAQDPMLRAIARNGKRLIRLASDLLVLSGLESRSAARTYAEPIDLTAVVTRAGQTCRSLASDRDLTVAVATPDHGVTVVGDGDHLERVVDNLLSNAVKFTPDGGSVSCRLCVEDSWAVIEVSDTGIGIPEAEQEQLFTRFFRASSAQERAIQGTGLGLSIIHEIVTAHGGSIDVRSAHLEGSTFVVRLPA